MQYIRKSDFVLLFEEGSYLCYSAQSNLTIQRTLAKEIYQLEKHVLKAQSLQDSFQLLLTMKAIGPILGLTIMLETENITRFESAGNYASYCRCVKSLRESNGKKKGTGNRKAGNKFMKKRNKNEMVLLLCEPLLIKPLELFFIC